ncbi:MULTISPECIES: DUF982 domain-containing protein [unclassified Rhizobium]|uniref:DUF982 domain-containing protein n=1 Tax=unclassified Rhizobium TaxID=2613769 RepID=UPI00254D1DED|nr:DUF982 domain-containing protein [Rhizobium sp. CNPSo 4062]MDK4701859.1 DUF982 domain-containing protein [Rhizobium sp. CNPSo 4062]
MGRNDKNGGADLDHGEQLVNSIPVEVPSRQTNADYRLALPPERTQAEESSLGRAPAEEDKLAALDRIARDMTLLATLVTRRRHAKSESTEDQDQAPLSDASNDPEELAFAPIGIAPRDGDEIQFIGSISQAVEYLTTQWPIRSGDAFEEALQACIDGVKGRASPERVRSAFLKAAGAASIRVIPSGD